MKFLTPHKALDHERQIEMIVENAVVRVERIRVKISPEIAAKEVVDYLKKNHIIIIKKK